MNRRISVSVPEELVAKAEAAVASGWASSVSAYVSQALDEKARHDRVIEVLDAMDRDLGPPSRSARTWARQVLGL